MRVYKRSLSDGGVVSVSARRWPLIFRIMVKVAGLFILTIIVEIIKNNSLSHNKEVGAFTSVSHCKRYVANDSVSHGIGLGQL